MIEDSGKSIVRRPARWDQPLSENMSDALVELALSSIHFRQMDANNFTKNCSLQDVLRNDCAVNTYQTNDIIVNTGAYLNSAFIILSGRAAMFVAPKPNALKIQHHTKFINQLGSSVKQWWSRSQSAEVRKDIGLQDSNVTGKPISYSQPKLQNLPEILAKDDIEVRDLKVGDVFGEAAVLGRNVMSHNVVAQAPCIILEIRWQGLRELRKRESAFKAYIDKLYRQRGLFEYLSSIPLFKSLPSQCIKELADTALFEFHGEFEWHSSFKKATKKSQLEQSFDHLIENEPVIAREGSYPDGLLLVRNGFARISRKVNHGQYTFGHLSAGGMFGLDELFASWQGKQAVELNCSLRALGYTDVIRVPSAWLEKNIFASNNSTSNEALEEALSSLATPDMQRSSKPLIDRKFTEFVVENRYINGSQTMMIDLQRCVRCDDCVTACANAHDNNPRFNRHGPKNGRYMIANACMHCEDPVCMIGCPTGAIHRAEDGVVSINDSTCIGCSTCANSCPYDNIRMVQVRDPDDNLLVDNKSVPIVKATKCDLCSSVVGGPACERACSHDALVRIDLKDVASLANWLQR
jgi:Fe-S-cluster-containing dehydrogenase component/CRP-like cAMP-binding protein